MVKNLNCCLLPNFAMWIFITACFYDGIFFMIVECDLKPHSTKFFKILTLNIFSKNYANIAILLQSPPFGFNEITAI